MLLTFLSSSPEKMSNHVPCLVFLFLICLLVLLFGGYYTYKYKKETILTSCYHVGGKCMEVEKCLNENHYRPHVTTCIHKRKVCCMPEPQRNENLDD